MAVIQLLGRWSSSAVERYTQSAPLTYAAAAVPAQALASTRRLPTWTGRAAGRWSPPRRSVG